MQSASGKHCNENERSAQNLEKIRGEGLYFVVKNVKIKWRYQRTKHKGRKAQRRNREFKESVWREYEGNNELNPRC